MAKMKKAQSFLSFEVSERGDFPAKSGITRLVKFGARENPPIT